MGGKRRRGRTIVEYHGRHFSLCRQSILPAPRTHPNSAAARTLRRAGLIPGATLLLIVLFSVCVLERPPLAMRDAERQMPIAGAAHFTFADFASASR